MAYTLKRKAWILVLGFIAVLFNPIFPVHLDRDTWVVIDIIAAIVMFVSIWMLTPRSSDSEGKTTPTPHQ